MLESFDRLKSKIAIILLFEIIILFIFFIFLFNYVYLLLFIYLLMNISFIYLIIQTYEKDQRDRIFSITRVLGKDAKDALEIGGVGIVTYDENYNVTWMSEIFDQRGISLIGSKITALSPEINKLFTGDSESLVIEVNDSIYEVIRKENVQLLFFRDITEISRLESAYDDEQVVLGLIHIDNYEETTQYEEEQKIALIDSQIRQPVVDWAKKHGMFLRRIKADRFLVVLNERIYKNVMNNRFDILSYIRKAAADADVAITLSMAFSRKTSDFLQLEEMVNTALELAQSRGGDQVAIKSFNEDTKYFGGSSQAQEKRSKVRVRVIAQTIRDLIQQSKTVIIVGHKEMDFDCMGAAIGMSRIALSYDKEVYIVSKSGGIEIKLTGALSKYKELLNQRHRFVSESEALEILNANTLVIMVDHNSAAHSNATSVIEKAKKVIVIDHHRRSTDFTFNPVLVYIESSASSVSELVAELFPYQVSNVDISMEEATIMFTGMLIDTNRFRNRTGSRTFEAASVLKNMGADSVEADNLLKDEFDEFELKTSMLKCSQQRPKGVVIAPYEEKTIVSRSIMSQVAEMLLSVKNVEASFVVARIDDHHVAVSARSKGKINVQIIMEKLSGGGHFSAAALQRENTTIEQMVVLLDKSIQEYFEQEG
ncbi:MAG: DHH family phosphoesterase [Erysipelotrichaceae bacterium]|nr:DHH family phosphoesterase [Erysipelotrichaceae bacterium]MDP3305276.1 DHH family phosphoesterase [Erysipelotrichaceae bacterium]